MTKILSIYLVTNTSIKELIQNWTDGAPLVIKIYLLYVIYDIKKLRNIVEFALDAKALSVSVVTQVIELLISLNYFEERPEVLTRNTKESVKI